MKESTKKTARAARPVEGMSRATSSAFYLVVAMLVLIPVAFSAGVYRIYSLPKFALLLVGSSALLPLLFLSEQARLLRSRHVAIVGLYFFIVAISTVFGVAPVASLFGSSYNQMGLLTQLCFFVCFLGLIVAVGKSERRLRLTLWAISITGLVVATFTFIQFFGHDPFGLSSFDFESGPVKRVAGTLGHADFLGNFLLYTTPIAAGLATQARGPARRLALIATAVSISAIAFSGTRGAWLGLVVGALTFAAFEMTAAINRLRRMSAYQLLGRAALSVVILAGAVYIISSRAASQNIVARMGTFVSDGFTGSGRTLLWRDSIKMAQPFALTGCGPEGFRKAFLAYKSKELARLAPGTNDESSHNSYLDAAISYGLPGAIAYIAIIVSTIFLLIFARRNAARDIRIILSSVLASFIAVIAHNIFIFDQISTGLYFFAFAALALSARAVTLTAKGADAPGPRIKTRRWKEAVIAAVGCAIAITSVWYSYLLIRSDVEIKRAFESAKAGNFDSVVKHGQRATTVPDPARDYSFLFARALTLCADRLQSTAQPGDREQASRGGLAEARTKILELAAEQAKKSLARTLTPDSNNLLLAYLALQSGDTDELHFYASEALRWDPNFSKIHWMMAEAHLARNDREQAAREAKLALNLDPHSREARLALRRARGRGLPRIRTVEELIAAARELAKDGKTQAALRIIRRAIHRSRGPCPECRSALATIYEASNLNQEAIAEWQVFMKETPNRASALEASMRIQKLRQSDASKQ